MTGLPVGFAIRVVFAGIASVIGALYGSWVLALITLPSYVILVGSWIANNRFSRYYLQKADVFVSDSNSVAVEAIENVSTISALGISDRLVSKFDQFLSPSYRSVHTKKDTNE